MNTTRTSSVIPATAVAALAALALTASPALADGGSGHSILRAELVGSMPADPPIAGVTPGGAPWVNGPSKARVREDGRIEVKIKGLVIPPPGSDPVETTLGAGAPGAGGAAGAGVCRRGEDMIGPTAVKRPGLQHRACADAFRARRMSERRPQGAGSAKPR